MNQAAEASLELADAGDEIRRALDFVSDPLVAEAQMRAAGRAPDPKLLTADTAGYIARVEYVLERLGWNDLIGRLHAQLGDMYGLTTKTVRDLLFQGDDRDRFDAHDSLVYPMTFGTNLGELDPVDILRISPADATPIEGVPAGRPALKGETVGAFGGFLDRRWRLHDMLLGRLHGAERLITAVLPGAEAAVAGAREGLIQRAQEAIAEEWARDFGAIVAEEEARYAASARS